MEQNKKDLIFLESYSIEDFKAGHNNCKIQVRKSKKTGKLYFRFGHKPNEGGKVTLKGLPTNPIISWVEGLNEEGKPEKFWLLHEDDTNEEVHTY